MASYWIDTLVLKNGGKYLRYFAASSLPLRGKPTQAQDVTRRISGALAGESMQKSTYQVPITIPISPITLFAIFLSFSSPPLHPCRFIHPSFVRLFVCFYVLLGLFARSLGIIVCLLKIRKQKVYGSSSAC